MENLVAIKEGCLTTFKMVYFQYHAKLYAYLVSKSSSSYIAEEVVQLTFIKLWNNRLNISEQFPIDVQLFRIARTILIDELRKDAVRNSYINQLEKTITADSTDRIADRDTLTQVNKAIELLPPMRKMVFKLSRFNHLTNAEIAEMLSLSSKTVENHISLAIKQLRKSAIATVSFLSLLEAMLNNY